MEMITMNIFEEVKLANRSLLELSEDQINTVLLAIAEETIANTGYILTENKKDLDRMDENDPKYDRLLLTKERIESITNDIMNVTKLKSPIGEVLHENSLDNGLHVSKVRVPLGVIGVIYEARPNVSFDVFSLCFKTKNLCILKGGSDAEYSNIAIVRTIQSVLDKYGINRNVVGLLPADRSATAELLNATKYVDVIIPRGSQGLINYVRSSSKVPVIETGAGIVHAYIDKDADIDKAKNIVTNAKTRRVSVCNALDCMLIHEDILSELNNITEKLAKKGTKIYADYKALANLDSYPKELLSEADESHYGTEFLSNQMSIKTVKNIDEALNHIAKNSSKHSETIISEDADAIEQFLNIVDAAAVYANSSTAFTDGAQFGLGAEIGISTQKLHARGPMGLEEITSYKWVIKGNGQTRR